MIVAVVAAEAAEADSEVAATSVAAEGAVTSTATVAPDTAAAGAGRTTGETTERDPTVVTESESDRAEQRTNELIHSLDARERRRSECTHGPNHHHHTAPSPQDATTAVAR